MKLDEIYRIAQQRPSQSSGTGTSYWSAAASCGRQVRLKEEALALEASGIKVFEEHTPEPGKLDNFKVGAYYHLLQEFGANDNIVWDAQEEAFNPEFKEALRLMRAYQSRYGSARQRWRMTDYRVEVQIPETEKGAALVLDLFGQPFTGRLDGLGYMDAAAVREVGAREKLPLPGPGLYILDHKSAKAQSANDIWEYECGLQACAYILMWNLEHPETPVQGMIFDQITKAKVPLFRSYFVNNLTPDPDRIRNLVRIGKHNLDNNICNPMGCKTMWKPCYWFKTGKCQGF